MLPEPCRSPSDRPSRCGIRGVAFARALVLACTLATQVAAGAGAAAGPAVLAAASPGGATANGASAPGGVAVEQAWSRATVPGMTVGVGYLTLVNRGRVADALVGASSPLAARVEVHSSRMEGGTMQMRQLQRVELPPGQVVRFEPGGLHLMLVGLERALVAGESVPLLLRFAAGGERRVLLRVEPLGHAPSR
ncbi:MAG: copper chaperone PCu(A)C [Steroidobacteraceae bacterium]|jgi:hypothetical protein|nr:copper chaperone PCu(A)C [Steroidobacteraceae bacterium]